MAAMTLRHDAILAVVDEAAEHTSLISSICSGERFAPGPALDGDAGIVSCSCE